MDEKKKMPDEGLLYFFNASITKTDGNWANRLIFVAPSQISVGGRSCLSTDGRQMHICQM